MTSRSDTPTYTKVCFSSFYNLSGDPSQLAHCYPSSRRSSILRLRVSKRGTMVGIPSTLADSFPACSGSRNSGAGQSSVVHRDRAARKAVSIRAHLSYTTLYTSRLPRANISPGAEVHWNPRLANAGCRHHRMWPLSGGDHSDLEHWVHERVRSVMMSIQT